MSRPPALDELDSRIIRLFTDQPSIGVLGASRALGVARGTVQARLDRLLERGVISGFAPQLDPRAMGFTVTAFVTLQIQQGAGAHEVQAELGEIAQVLEAHTITGDGDLLVRLVARDNADLQHVIDRVVSVENVSRSSTVIALETTVSMRTLPLLDVVQDSPGPSPSSAGGRRPS